MYKLLQNGYKFIPDTYTFFASKSKLSDKRKAEIEERRGRLKIDADDPKIVRVIIEEMLAYKPGVITLDDRYLQLEQILDAIEKAKTTKQTDDLVSLCEDITKENIASSGFFKNAFLERLQSINTRLKLLQHPPIKAKL